MSHIALDISGMTCAACSARVAKALSRVDGVADAEVNLALERANIELAGEVTAEKLIAAVEKAGYGATLRSADEARQREADAEREVEFVLRFTEASAIIVPKEFRRFDHIAMIEELRPKLPKLKHVLVVGEDIPAEYFDVRGFLDGGKGEIDAAALRERRPHPNQLQRTAFTSGTTGDPKAVLHIHNTSNYMCWVLNDGQRITADVLSVFSRQPDGSRWIDRVLVQRQGSLVSLRTLWSRPRPAAAPASFPAPLQSS